MRPIYGSNAYKYETAQQYRDKTQVKRQKKARKNSKKAVMRSVALTVFVTLLAFCLLWRNAQIMEQKSQIAKLQNDIAHAEAKIIEKQFEVEKNIDLSEVEDKAIAELGMQRPEKSQIVYIDMYAEDYAEGSTQDKGGNLISAFIKRIWNN